MKIFLIVLLELFTLMKADMYCDHPIFCNQDILSAVADSHYYKDSKEFVDQVLKVPIEQALQYFKNYSVKDFIENCFDSPDSILETVQIEDYVEFPSKLKDIMDPNLSQLAYQLNKRWKQLARRVNLDYINVKTGKCIERCSSFLPEMNGRIIIIPGGRFRQSYYWDSYWIIKGLIVCDMLSTAQKLLQNFIIMIENYGHIPNGFRLYFLNRSQPPFFSLMVKQVIEAYKQKGNKQKAEALEQKFFNHLIAEQKYFMSTHTRSFTLQSGREILLNVYNADTILPRPQAYFQDKQLVQGITNKEQKDYILKSLSTMAESGWDFSSRWLRDPQNLRSSVILQMIPSDLNVLMGLLESYLSTLSSKFGRIDLYNQYQQRLKDRKDYFTQKFISGRYPDTYPSGINQQNRIYPTDYFAYLLFSDRTANISGIYEEIVNPSCSLQNTHQQWDKPNVWAPNSWILHEVTNIQTGYKIAQEWVSTVYCGWAKTDNIYQKYIQNKLGQRGQGGQYEPQTGFGWTNGLTLYYLSLYKDLKLPQCPE